MSERKAMDPELSAMGRINRIFEELSPEQRTRVLRFVEDRYGRAVPMTEQRPFRGGTPLFPRESTGTESDKNPSTF